MADFSYDPLAPSEDDDLNRERQSLFRSPFYACGNLRCVELRARGSPAIDAANERMANFTKEEWDAKELLEEAIKVQLRIAMATGNPKSDEAKELARMHKKWITIHWGEGYLLEAYLGLVKGYLQDPRFVKYYNSAASEGATRFLANTVEYAYEERDV